jgi:small subunit ribosomal protein S4
LNSKQKLKFFYGKLPEKKLNQLYENAHKKFKNQNNECLINKNFYLLELLEKRLDVILYRTTFVDSIRSAQQLISHGKVFINGKKVTINSYLIQTGDLLEIHFTFHKYLLKNMSLFEKKIIIPKYLEINFKTFQCLIISDINFNKIMYNFPFWLSLNKLFNRH